MRRLITTDPGDGAGDQRSADGRRLQQAQPPSRAATIAAQLRPG
jgi:hypothetical protein